MQSAVVTFPGSNCEAELIEALSAVTGKPALRVWHKESQLPPCDLLALPGGFSYGDYLRPGAMAARSPIMRAVREKAKQGLPVLGICNGFQLLCEAGLLPGILGRNIRQRFICRLQSLTVDNPLWLASQFKAGEQIAMPISHHDGNYLAPQEELERLEGEGLVFLRYSKAAGEEEALANPNGSQRAIAGIASSQGRVLGMMPHPERLFVGWGQSHNTAGQRFFQGLMEGLA